MSNARDDSHILMTRKFRATYVHVYSRNSSWLKQRKKHIACTGGESLIPCMMPNDRQTVQHISGNILMSKRHKKNPDVRHHQTMLCEKRKKKYVSHYHALSLGARHSAITKAVACNVWCFALLYNTMRTSLTNHVTSFFDILYACTCLDKESRHRI